MNTTTTDPRHIIHAYLSNHHLATLATCSLKGKPEAAVMGYTCDANLEIVFATFADSRKALNINENPRVALVVGWENGRSLQYEGVAHKLVGKVAAAVAEKHYATTPTIAKYVHKAKQNLYRVKPTWIRLTDFHQDPWQVSELDF